MEKIRALGSFMNQAGIVQFLWGNPHVAALFDELGLEPGRGYFVLRAAPMGTPRPELVGNAFGFFPPKMVAKLVARDWAARSPDEVLAVAVPRLEEAARSVFEGVEGVPELAAWCARAREQARCEGRMLATAWSTVEFDEADPHAALFFHGTVLREHRGDGHLLAVQRHGLTCLEALVLSNARRGKDPTKVATTRGWRPEEVAEALESLAARGALDGDAITEAGMELWEAVEATTDHLAAHAWDGLDVDEVLRLAEGVFAAARLDGQLPPGA